METVHTEEYKGYTINIIPDEGADNPRDWDNQGTMVCFHRNYTLGDKHELSVEEAKELVSRKNVISLPLYLYDHSGITMNTTGFHCPWDSGQVGFIYVTKEDVRKEYSVKKISKKLLNMVIQNLISEVKVYDAYLTGDVYGYEIEHDGEYVDSCWGYFGEEDAIAEAKVAVDYYAEKSLTNVNN